MKIEALILDAHIPYAVSLENKLRGSNLFGRVLVFNDAPALIDALKQSIRGYPRYLFLDYYLGEKTLPEIHHAITEVSPNLKIIVISSITNPVLLRNLLAFKPDGIIHKTDRICDIIKCVEQISEGNKYYTRSIKEILKSKKAGKVIFSPREIEVISFLARGFTSEQIGAALSISPNTVVSHKRKMFKKINCHTTDELLMYAIKKKIIE